MKLLKGAASVLALALFVLPVLADDVQAPPAQTLVEQQVAQAADANLPPEVISILSEQRGVGDLSVDELKARAEQALRFAKDESLPPDIRDQLKSLGDAAKANLAARAQAEQPVAPAEEAPKQAEQPVEPAPVAEAPKQQEQAPAAVEPAPAAPVVDAPKQPEPQTAPVVEAPAVPAAEPPKQAEQPVALPDEVLALLADTRAPADLTPDELNVRAKTARRFAKDGSLPKDVREQLAGMATAAHEEFVAREQKKKDQQAAPKVDAPVIASEPPKAVEPAAPAVAGEAPKAAEPAAPAVAGEAPKVAEPAPPAVVEEAPKVAAPAIILEAPPALPADAAAAQVIAPPAPPPAPTAAEVKALDGNAGNPEAEQKARAYLDEVTPLEKLSNDDLRVRLDSARELMSKNQLSSDTEKAVREKLKSEREVLRARLAEEQAKQMVDQAAKQSTAPPIPAAEKAAINATPLPAVPVQPPAPPPAAGTTTNNATVNNTTINNTVIITNVTPVQVVLADRRPPEDLQLAELRRRVQVYNDAQYDDNYDAENRDYWRASVARDREILRRRMIAERRARAEQLALNANDDSLNISINLDFSPSRPLPPRAVFAAEVDDQELQDVLVAPPRRSIKQRYSFKEITAQPRLRDAVSRIEIDTIRFGTNEGFIREEQLDSLDGIAAIIERIVKKYPNEVFMIEGHTDAPGTDAYNLKLSKARAEAIKKALSTYYVIPAQNLRTVGLGERFLKIPTSDAEPENRRVSIARITQLLGKAQ